MRNYGRGVIAILTAVLVLALLSSNFALAEERKVEINFFYSSTCPHCAEEEKFLEELKQKYPEVEIKEYEIFRHPENQKILSEFYARYRVSEKHRGQVPITFTPTNYFLGFDENIGQDIENCIRECLIGEGPTPQKKVKIPIFGEIDISKLSLPLAAVMLGFVDGFDVCSLAALFLILTIVLSFKSRFKVLFFGGVFILINALTYGLLMSFWWKVFNLVGIYLRKMEVLIGLLSIGGGIYFIRKFLKIRKTGPVCEAEAGWGKEIFAKGATKIKELFQKENAFYIILGLLIFDLIVSFVEFPCSGVLPVIFTGILSEAGISTLQYFFYLAIFLFFYLLDELIVFLVAVFTMKIWVSSPKFVTWSNFSVAIILLLLGFYYLAGALF